MQGAEFGALAILDLNDSRTRLAEHVLPPGDLRFSPDGKLLALDACGALTAAVGVQWWTRERGWRPTGGPGRTRAGRRGTMRR